MFDESVGLTPSTLSLNSPSFDGQSGGLAGAEGRGRRDTRRVLAASGDEWEGESMSESEEDKEEYEDEEFG